MNKVKKEDKIKAKEEEKIMFESLSIDDIRQAIQVLSEKAKVLTDQARTYTSFLLDRNNRYSQDYNKVADLQMGLHAESQRLFNHIEKLRKRAAFLEGRQYKEIKGVSTGIAPQFKKLTQEAIVNTEKEDIKER
jgi:hypothetical protein